MDKNTYVIALGGSLISPEYGKINVSYLKKFKNFIISRVENNEDKFIIIAGGGKTARKYQNALENIVEDVSNRSLDWMGINATKLNAQLIKEIFESYAQPRILKSLKFEDKLDFKNILVCSGYRPGNSTDYCAVKHAENYGASKVINLSNVKGVFSEDPEVNPDAIMYDNISWVDYRKLIPKDWKPGMSAPFDPVASEQAQILGIEVLIVGSDNKLENLENSLNKNKFDGTIIY